MQSCFDLYGPESQSGKALRYNHMNWGWPGSAVTASTVRINFNLWSRIDEAEIELVWYPYDRAYAHFFMCDYVSKKTPVNKVSFQQQHSPVNWDPVTVRNNLTSWMQQFLGMGVKYFAYQLHGNLILLSNRLYMGVLDVVCDDSAA